MNSLENAVVVGVDQSARGTAAVALKGGVHYAQVFYADTKTAADRFSAFGAVAPMGVKAGDEYGRTARLDALLNLISGFLKTYQPTHMALEDYAMARQAHVHSLGEVGAVVRLVAYWLDLPFRVYDVQAVKLFATGRGDAQKADMIIACRSKWDQIDFTRFGKEDGAGGNLADAYVIAKILWSEVRLRAGSITLDELEDHERRVFLRTTKQHPVNLLDMPFAERARHDSAHA